MIVDKIWNLTKDGKGYTVNHTGQSRVTLRDKRTNLYQESPRNVLVSPVTHGSHCGLKFAQCKKFSKNFSSFTLSLSLRRVYCVKN